MSSSCEDNQGSDTSFSTSSPAPQSPQEETTGDTSVEEPHAAMLIVDVMASPGDGTRLVSSRCQTNRPLLLGDSQSVTNDVTQKVYQGPQRNSPNSLEHHVGILERKKNDITLENTATISKKHVEEQVPSLFSPSSNRTPHSQNDGPAASRMASSESAHKSANTSSPLRARPLVVQGLGETAFSSSASREATSSVVDAEETRYIKSAINASVSSVQQATEQETREEKGKSCPRKVIQRTIGDRINEETKDSSTMSVMRTTPTKKNRRKRSPQVKAGQTTGRWTQEEHQAFLEGLKECGREWKKVSLRIPTRTSAQIRSHAQKYFAKLQRDQETLSLNDGCNVIGGSRGMAGLAPGAVPLSDRQSLTPAIQRNVERIMSNPSAAQQEVEDTLDALRNRYRQLQLRLEQRQQQRRARGLQVNNPVHHHHIVEEPESPSQHRMAAVSSPCRKRTLQNVDLAPVPVNAQNQHQFHHDDLSSVSSTISASVASMGNDELIALSVLGGSLTRENSSHDLQRMAARESDSSVTSTTEHGRNLLSSSARSNSVEFPENRSPTESVDATVLDRSGDDQCPSKRAKKN